MNPEVSVVVPVYNVEKWLPKCIDSILCQTYKDFELILINDGSTDGSLDICRTFEAKDNRVRVIDGPNKGSSAARNTGLELARGEWIIFCDSDDWWDLQLLEKLHTAAIENDADIAACNIILDFNDHKESLNYPYKIIEPTNMIPLVDGVFSSGCNKLIRSNLFKIYGIKGVRGITMWDDHLMTSRLRFHSRKTVIVNEGLYHYNRCVNGSICQTNDKKFPESQIKVVGLLDDYYSQIAERKELSKAIVTYAQLRLLRDLGYVEWKKVFPKVRFSWIALNCIKSRRQRIKGAIAILFPYKMCVLIKLVYRKVKHLR